MTAPLNLDALQALCDAATPAPWVKRPLNGRKYYGTHIESPEGGVIEIWRFGHRDETASAEELGEWGSDEPFEYCDSHYQTVTDAADADFIAAARSAVPALIQEVRRRGELVERAYGEGLSRGFHHDDHEHVIDTDKEWKASEVHSALHNGQ